jgi:hypothetical protein
MKRLLRFAAVVLAISCITGASIFWYSISAKQEMINYYNKDYQAILQSYQNIPNWDKFMLISPELLKPFGSKTERSILFKGKVFSIVMVHTPDQDCPIKNIKAHSPAHEQINFASGSFLNQIQAEPRGYCENFIENNGNLYEITPLLLLDIVKPKTEADFQNTAILLGTLPKKTLLKPLIFTRDYYFTNTDIWSSDLKFNCKEQVSLNLKSIFKPGNSYSYYAHSGDGYEAKSLEKVTIKILADNTYTFDLENILTCQTDIVC